MMKALFNGLSALATPVGCIIHVGAGQCSELQSYLDLDPQQIILIEADTQQVMQLKSMTQSQKKINVLACAVADKKEAETLKILSNPRDSSLLMPEKILDYYPSLAIVSEQAVTTETLNDVLKGYALDKDYQHLLILEVQGLEGVIIKSASVEYLQQFSGIIIRSSAEQLYQQEQQEDIVNLLTPAGFECSYQENEQYSNAFTKLYFQRNDEKIALIQCRQQINELTASNAEQTKLAAERLQQVKKFKQECDAKVKVVAEKQSQVEHLNTENTGQAKLAAEHQQQVKKLKQERDVKVKMVVEKQSQIEQLNTAKAEQTKLATERQQQVEKLKQKCDAQAKVVAEKQSQIEQLNTEKAEQAKLAAERLQQVKKFKQECDAKAKVSAEKQSQIEQLNTAKAEQTKLATEHRQQVEKLKQERDAKVKMMAEKQSQIEQLLVAKEESTQLAIEIQQQIEMFTEECDLQTKQSNENKTQLGIKSQNIEHLKTQNSELDRQLKEFREKENKRQQELEEVRKMTSLSVKLQMIKENDLQDLQQRYQSVLATQESQHELLNKLSERLSLAAEYYHQISPENLVAQETKQKLSFWNPFKLRSLKK